MVLPSPFTLVRNKLVKGSPRTIGNRLRQLVVFDHTSDIQVFHRYRCHLVFVRELMADLVQKVFALIADVFMEPCQPFAGLCPVLTTFLFP